MQEGADGEEGEISAAALRELVDANGDAVSCANVFCDSVKYRADSGAAGAGGEVIVDFDELLALTPRYVSTLHDLDPTVDFETYSCTIFSMQC